MLSQDDITARAYLRARGRCECRLETCGHQGRCAAELQPGRWRGFIVCELAGDALARCWVLCEPCYEQAIRRETVM